jgi:PAS domain S-box-containing protein
MDCTLDECGMKTHLSPLFQKTSVRYLFAVVAVTFTFALRIWLIPLTGTGAPFVLFFAAILATSLFAGVRPGIFAVFLSMPLAAHMFVMRAGYPVFQVVFQSLLFGVDGLVVCYLTSLTNKGRKSAEHANRQLRSANEEISRSMARTREVIELAPDAFLQADLNARFTDVNQAACRMLGYDHNELVGKTVFDIIPAEDVPRLEAVRTELLKRGAVVRREWTLIRKDGTFVPVEVGSNILPDGRWQAFVRDVSERKRIEAERQVFVAFLENSPDFIGIADQNRKTIYVNPAGLRMVGLPTDYPVEKTVPPDFYTAEQRAYASVEIRRSLYEQGRWRGETYYRHWQTEQAIPVSAEHFLIRDPKTGRLLGMGTISRNISEARRLAAEREQLLASERQARQQAETVSEQLRQSEERFRLTLDEAPIGMALVTADRRLSRVNRAFCDMVGYSPDELKTMRYPTITHPDDVYIDTEHMERLARGEIPRYRIEKRYVRKDGEIVNIVLSRSILRDRDGAPLYYITQTEDITEIKRAEEALRRAVAERDHVLGIVAHDLRNPLSNIIVACSTLEPGVRESERRLIEIVLRAATHANRLIQDLLDVSLVEVGQLKIERHRVSATDLVCDAVRMQAPLASSSGIDLRLAVDKGAPDVFCDRDRLLRVLENLIGNALKFTHAGGHITVGAAPKDHEVMFWVEDTGCGIPSEDLTHVFDRFWQATTKAGRLGAGLGLPITKGIVEAHGGHIWAESKFGKGSSFFFTLPLAGAGTTQDRAA